MRLPVPPAPAVAAHCPCASLQGRWAPPGADAGEGCSRYELFAPVPLVQTAGHAVAPNNQAFWCAPPGSPEPSELEPGAAGQRARLRPSRPVALLPGHLRLLPAQTTIYKTKEACAPEQQMIRESCGTVRVGLISWAFIKYRAKVTLSCQNSAKQWREGPVCTKLVEDGASPVSRAD